ncbi:MAG: hypothetical protein ACP5XB_25190 [Isosphaeraceae bacterium]
MLDHSEHGSEPGAGPIKLHSPEEIARRLGGMAVKSLAELIRKTGVETTTIGYEDAPRKGGKKRRLWGMTDAQLQELLKHWRPRTNKSSDI